MPARYPSADARARIRQTVLRVEAMPRSTRGERRHFPQPWPGDPTKSFRIAGHTEIETGTNRWAYDGVEVQPERTGRYKDVTDGLTVTLYNRIEAGNDGVGVEGDGTDRDDLPPFMEIQPIGIGAVVRGWPVINCDGNPEWHFEVPNNPGGDCP